MSCKEYPEFPDAPHILPEPWAVPSMSYPALEVCIEVSLPVAFQVNSG